MLQLESKKVLPQLRTCIEVQQVTEGRKCSLNLRDFVLAPYIFQCFARTFEPCATSVHLNPFQGIKKFSCYAAAIRGQLVERRICLLVRRCQRVRQSSGRLGDIFDVDALFERAIG